MNSDGPSEAEVMAAIEQSGYLIEQEVATIIESLGFIVKTNRAYEDIEELKSREIDVWGHKEFARNDTKQLHLCTEIICECKNNSSPFVFIQRDKGPIDQHLEPQEYIFPLREYHEAIRDKEGKPTGSFRLAHPFNHLNLAKVHYCYKENLKTVQFCKIIRKGNKWEANHDGIYDAIFYPLVKALQSRIEFTKQFRDHRGPKYVWLFFPIVVLTGKIYSLDEKTRLLKEENHVTFVRELKSKKISGDFALDFVQKDSLKDFINTKLVSFTNHIADIVTKNPDILLDENK